MLIIVALLFSGFFSGMEIAFVSANRLRIQLMNKQGTWSGKMLAPFVKQPSHFIGTSLVGNNIALVIYGILMAKVLEGPLLDILPLAFQGKFYLIISQTVISTFIVLVTGEYLPKALFKMNPRFILSLFAIPFRLIYYLLYPFVIFSVWVSKLTLKVFFHESFPQDSSLFGKMDLEYIFRESDKTTLEEEANIDPKVFQKALYLRDVKVRECMVPRTEVKAVDVNEDIEKLKNAFVKTKLSKIIIYNKTIDNIIGYVHHFAMLQQPQNIHSIVMSIPLVPETMRAVELLDLLTREQKTIAWVVDEFGGTAGIVTLEDVIEEIFGEIEDEFDEEELVERKLDARTFIFSARLEVDYINEKYGLNLPTGDYETLAGFIIEEYESIPQENEHIRINGFIIKILKSRKNKIDRIKLSLKK
jgi:CBS domain containing-hemolysin-like protein